MIEVAALAGSRTGPSTRFRVGQYVAPLREVGIRVHEYYPPFSIGMPSPLPPPLHYLWSGIKLTTRLPGVLRSRRQQIVWTQRELLPGRYTLERWLKSPRVFDVDDAIWLTSSHAPDAMRRVARESDMVFAGNAVLADWFSPHAREIRIIPTAIDTDRFTPALGTERRDRFVVGWTGTHFNLAYLQGLEPPLRRFFERHDDAELLVIADHPPVFSHLPPERVRFLRWTPDNEVSAVQEMDVGLMPLADSEWTRGKCSFKMLQYMACGLPVIVSPVGMNADLLAQAEIGFGPQGEDEWYDALEAVYADHARARALGAAGRRLVEQRYSRAVVAEQIRAAFVSLV